MIKATKKYTFNPDYAVPPGETLKETIEFLGMTQKELSARTGLSVQSLNRILKGEQSITYETANILELVLNVPASMWNNLEAQYREQLAKIHERKRLEEKLEWLKTIPVAELVKRQVLPHCKNQVDQLRAVLSFFGVGSVNSWHQIWDNPAVAARRSECFKSCPGTASAWIRQGEIKANSINCADFSKEKFSKAVSKIRAFTVLTPEKFINQMVSLCAEAGVALVFVPEMKKAPWYGATKWLSSKKAMIILNLRGKKEDLFWFAFFHEAGHVLHDSKKDLLINTGKKKQDDEREIRADNYAAELLIPEKYNERIKRLRSKIELIKLANELKISPAIVVGRYHHLTKKFNFFNDLRRTFEWSLND
ncbi:MAG: ImmA/IrrE family metallo-endopeptidase [Candidatus Electrothrix scaldis]|nr:MAG: ImmA/IrrE family metallo-endopeptidase [Candidatus Electrothrix sp. GW3-3]